MTSSLYKQSSFMAGEKEFKLAIAADKKRVRDYREQKKIDQAKIKAAKAKVKAAARHAIYMLKENPCYRGCIKEVKARIKADTNVSDFIDAHVSSDDYEEKELIQSTVLCKLYNQWCFNNSLSPVTDRVLYLRAGKIAKCKVRRRQGVFYEFNTTLVAQ